MRENVERYSVYDVLSMVYVFVFGVKCDDVIVVYK